MRYTKYLTAIILVGIFTIQSCEKDYNYKAPPPHVAGATATLEAQYVSSAPSAISSSYWKTADYLKVNAVNVSINGVYGDGLLNMTGTYNGTTSFSKGVNPGLTLKAAYDNDKIYILAEWSDTTVNLSEASWLWDGPLDPLKTDTSGSWTSQRNNDKFALAFEIQSASSSFGTFNSVGCAASCHTGINNSMHPDVGTVDIWNWNLARSSPLGYAQDLVADPSSLSDDSGNKMHARNVNGATNRSGPAYEWNGVSQTITLANGQSATLDPAFYLYNKMPFLGNIANGDSLFHNDVLNQPGHCNTCHGERGEGAINSAINSVSLNKKSRTTLMSNMDNVSDMTAYWNNNLTSAQKDDIIAYIRGLCGVPGYYLTHPDGSNADIVASSNVTPVQITNAILPVTNVHSKYQLLLVRKLKTNNADDIQLDPNANRTYKFGVALMDNDGKNHIGSLVETLTLK
ncbi:MAG: ethylbenzene dehydrogenase-related protein [Bacteroidia bacterium]